MSVVRLDRLLANLGYGSRREVGALIAAGAVSVDGAPARDGAARIPLGPDLPARIRVAGAALDPPHPLVLVMHKPTGLVCSHREPGRSVYELLPARWRARKPALSTVGRLDLDTSGLLLVTDDGDFLHRVISPRAHIEKVYLARLDAPVEAAAVAAFASGRMLIEGEREPLRPAKLELLDGAEARVTLTEGRHRQVRRMFAAVGRHVEALHRESVGRLRLPPDLPAGAFRPATAAEQAAALASGDAPR